MNLTKLNWEKSKSTKRVGRGISAGGGKTAGRGTKGQNSRSGGQRNPGFEGGQNPLFQRIPKKKGFKSKRAKLQTIRLSRLENLKATTVTHQSLVDAGMAAKDIGAKLVFDVLPKKAYKVELQAASKRAQESLVKSGGSFTPTPLKKVSQKPANTDKSESKSTK